MKTRSWSIRRVFLVLLLACGLAGFGLVPSLSLTAAEDAAAAKTDPFKIPDGDAAALQKYIEKLAQTPPEGKTEEEQMAFSTKALETLVAAADKLLAAKPDDEQTVLAYNYKLQALQALVSMEQPKAREKFEKAVEEARKDKRNAIKGLGWQLYILDRTENWTQLNDVAKKSFHDEILGEILADGAKPIDASIVQLAAMRLDGQDDEYLAKLLGDALALFKKSDDKQTTAAVEEANFAGMLRRLKLPGHEMEIKGELLGGGEVDWKSYRGKVVLVDFWATWCGPCRAEVPNVLEMYHAYHDKGFDVLGVSLDTKPEDAKKYVNEMQLPWDSIFPKDEEQRQWNNPLARYYGIGGIPTAILVGKDGKVVHMNARGEILRDQLAKLLGEPAKKLGEAKESAGRPAKAS
jgi:thiol-disulfide isomerase/thioredoxin